MNNIAKIIQRQREGKIISTEDWKILIFPVLNRMNINPNKISFNIVSYSEMKTKRGFPKNYLGGSILKSEVPSLRKDEIWINNKLPAGQIVRILGHEIGHIITQGGSIQRFGRLMAESSAFSIDRKFVRIFNELYSTKVTTKNPEHGSSLKERNIYHTAWKQSLSLNPTIKREYIL